MQRDAEIDPITLEVICGSFISSSLMRATLLHTAYSSVIYHTDDFSCVFSARKVKSSHVGGVPGHVFASSLGVLHVAKRFGKDIFPNDVIMMNDRHSRDTPE